MPTIDVRGTAVEFVEQGRGEPVLLLHSSGGSSGQWRALIDRLAGRYRVMAPDFYGYGATGSWPGHAAFTLKDEAEIVVALLRRAGEPAHLVGHSYGGAVALHVARERTGWLRSVSLIEPVAFHLLRDGTGPDAQGVAEITAVAEGVGRALASGDYLAGFGRFIDYWSGTGAWDSIPVSKHAPLAARLPKVALDFHATFNEPARLEHFRALALPALVVRGACSPLPTRRICERLAAVLPQVQARVVEGAGHMCPVTHRDHVNALIVARLESAERASRLSKIRSQVFGPAVAAA
jgi:pimeloyl-ACP methyl ester carboxylesterase